MEQRSSHYMPPSLLGSQLATLEALQPDEPGFVVSGELPPDRIVDEIAVRLGVTRSGRTHETDPVRSNGEGSPAT
jgi:gluconokinase